MFCTRQRWCFWWTFIDNTNMRSQRFENSSAEGTSASSEDAGMKSALLLFRWREGKSIQCTVATQVPADREAFTNNTMCACLCAHAGSYACICVWMQRWKLYIMHHATQGSTHSGINESRWNYLHSHTAPCSSQRTVMIPRWSGVSGVHDNIFRQTTVVNHL